MPDRKPVLMTVLYDGTPLVEVDHDGGVLVSSTGCAKARIARDLLDVDSGPLRKELTKLNQVASAALCNPYRTALDSVSAIHKAIPPTKRGAIRVHEIKTIVDAIVRVASRSVQ